MATNIFITYDLLKPGQDYGSLIKTIKSLGSWAHVQDSVWYVRATKSAESIRDLLMQHIDQDDSILVIDATNNETAWHGLHPQVAEHIQKSWNAAVPA